MQSYAKKSELPTKVSQLTNDSGFLTSVPSEYVTETELNAKGYQNSTQVNSAITSKGYQTASQVESAITSKGYITEADIESEEATITIAASAWSNGVLITGTIPKIASQDIELPFNGEYVIINIPNIITLLTIIITLSFNNFFKDTNA